MDISEIQKGLFLIHQGKFREAEEYFLKLEEKNPDDANLLSTLGIFYAKCGDYIKACNYFEKAYGINKTEGNISAWAEAEFRAGDWIRAAHLYEKVIEQNESEEYYDKLVQSEINIHNFKKATEFVERMYALYSDSETAQAQKINVLTKTGKLLEAEQLCVELLKQKQESPQLWQRLGLLKELIYSDDRQAKECYKISAQYGNPASDYNIGVCCTKLGEFEEANIYFKKMLEKFPDNTAAITSLSMNYLRDKNFKEGYELFAKRTDTNFPKDYKKLIMPGDNLEDEFYLLCDMGLGDNIQFIRYIPFIKNKKFKILAQKPMMNLFKYNYPEYDFVYADDFELDFNIQSVRTTDLPYILDMDFDNIPSAEGYLDIDNPLDIKSDKLKVGLCWEAGGVGVRDAINRTINVKLLEPIFNLQNIQTYSFQYEDTFGGNEKYPQMINLAKDFKDFADTARALKAMDLFITVDTSVAHLAGAMGVKTFLLLPYTTDWRWFHDTETTPWYKSIRIFKQTNPVDWTDVIQRVVENIA